MDLSSRIDWQFFTVDIELSGSIVADAEPDPGILMCSGSAWYHVSAEDYDEEDYPEPEQAPQWDAAVAKGYAFSLRNQDDDFAQWQVLTMCGVIVDPYLASGSIPDELDGMSADYGSLARLFSGNELHPDLLDMIEGAGTRAILIDRANLAVAWRGFGGVGRLLISRILRMVSTFDTAVVATIPFPIDLYKECESPGDIDQHPHFDEELRRVRRTWESIGFRQYKGEIWVMDPAKVHHDDAVRQIEARLPGRL
ncbi:hypothetical protein [Nocardia sp. NPDC019395]|uniref:hypothetical protein n=1 Tax=Nocardia sp. NPDC019395 TaxID=3154686 RepID=UPI0033E8C7F3